MALSRARSDTHLLTRNSLRRRLSSDKLLQLEQGKIEKPRLRLSSLRKAVWILLVLCTLTVITQGIVVYRSVRSPAEVSDAKFDEPGKGAELEVAEDSKLLHVIASAKQACSSINPEVIEAVLFDLDDVLYPKSSGMWDIMTYSIEDYLVAKMHIPREHVADLIAECLRQYGMTLAGLRHGVRPPSAPDLQYTLNETDFLEHLYNSLPYDSIKPNPSLRETLLSLRPPKYIFSNSDRKHCVRVLKRLGIHDLFVDIIDVYAMQWKTKPSPAAYHTALLFANVHNPSHALFLDDSRRNINAAVALGIQTVLVGTADPALSDPRTSLRTVTIDSSVDVDTSTTSTKSGTSPNRPGQTDSSPSRSNRDGGRAEQRHVPHIDSGGGGGGHPNEGPRDSDSDPGLGKTAGGPAGSALIGRCWTPGAEDLLEVLPGLRKREPQ